MTKLSDAAVYDSNNQCICVIIDENKADTETAAFIVAACNAYEANQKALMVAVDELTKIAKPALGGKQQQQWAQMALERIREIQEGKECDCNMKPPMPGHTHGAESEEAKP